WASLKPARVISYRNSKNNSNSEAPVVRRERSITKHWMLTLAILFASTLAVEGQDPMTNSGSWSGVIINSGCTVDEAFAETAKCMEKAPGAKLVLYDDTTRQIYDLEPQAQTLGNLGSSVTVEGALDGRTI